MHPCVEGRQKAAYVAACTHATGHSLRADATINVDSGVLHARSSLLSLSLLSVLCYGYNNSSSSSSIIIMLRSFAASPRACQRRLLVTGYKTKRIMCENALRLRPLRADAMHAVCFCMARFAMTTKANSVALVLKTLFHTSAARNDSAQAEVHTATRSRVVEIQLAHASRRTSFARLGAHAAPQLIRAQNGARLLWRVAQSMQLRRKTNFKAKNKPFVLQQQRQRCNNLAS